MYDRMTDMAMTANEMREKLVEDTKLTKTNRIYVNRLIRNDTSAKYKIEINIDFDGK